MLPLLAVALLDSVSACQELHLPETSTVAGAKYALAEGVQLVFGRDESLDRSRTTANERCYIRPRAAWPGERITLRERGIVPPWSRTSSSIAARTNY